MLICMRYFFLVMLFLISSCETKYSRESLGGVIVSFSSSDYPLVGFPVKIKKIEFIDENNNVIKVPVDLFVNVGGGETRFVGGFEMPAKTYNRVKVTLTFYDSALALYDRFNNELLLSQLVDAENFFIPQDKPEIIVTIHPGQPIVIKNGELNLLNVHLNTSDSLTAVEVKSHYYTRFQPSISINKVASLPAQGVLSYSGVAKNIELSIGNLPKLSFDVDAVLNKKTEIDKFDSTLSALNGKVVNVNLSSAPGRKSVVVQASTDRRFQGLFISKNNKRLFNGYETNGNNFKLVIDYPIEEFPDLQCFLDDEAVDITRVDSGQKATVYFNEEASSCYLEPVHIFGRATKIDKTIQVAAEEISLYKSEILNNSLIQFPSSNKAGIDVGQWIQLQGYLVESEPNNFIIKKIEYSQQNMVGLRLDFDKTQETSIAAGKNDLGGFNMYFLDVMATKNISLFYLGSRVSIDSPVNTISMGEDTVIQLSIDNDQDRINYTCNDLAVCLSIVQSLIHSGEKKISSLNVNGHLNDGMLKAKFMMLSLQRPFVIFGEPTKKRDFILNVDSLLDEERDKLMSDVMPIVYTKRLIVNGYLNEMHWGDLVRYSPEENAINISPILAGPGWQSVKDWFSKWFGAKAGFIVLYIEGLIKEYDDIAKVEKPVHKVNGSSMLQVFEAQPNKYLDENDQSKNFFKKISLKYRFIYDKPETQQMREMLSSIPEAFTNKFYATVHAKDYAYFIDISNGKLSGKKYNLEKKEWEESKVLGDNKKMLYKEGFGTQKVVNKYGDDVKFSKEFTDKITFIHEMDGGGGMLYIRSVDDHDIYTNLGSYESVGDEGFQKEILYLLDSHVGLEEEKIHFGGAHKNTLRKDYNFDDYASASQYQPSSRKIVEKVAQPFIFQRTEDDFVEKYGGRVKQYMMPLDKVDFMKKYNEELKVRELDADGDKYKFVEENAELNAFGYVVVDEEKKIEPVGEAEFTVGDTVVTAVIENEDDKEKEKEKENENEKKFVTRENFNENSEYALVVPNPQGDGEGSAFISPHNSDDYNEYVLTDKSKDGRDDSLDMDVTPRSNLNFHFLLDDDLEATNTAYKNYYQDPDHTVVIQVSNTHKDTPTFILAGGENLGKLVEGTSISWVLHGQANLPENLTAINHFEGVSKIVKVRAVATYNAKHLARLMGDMPSKIMAATQSNISVDVDKLRPQHISFSADFMGKIAEISGRSYLEKVARKYASLTKNKPVFEAFIGRTVYSAKGDIEPSLAPFNKGLLTDGDGLTVYSDEHLLFDMKSMVKPKAADKYYIDSGDVMYEYRDMYDNKKFHRRAVGR